MLVHRILAGVALSLICASFALSFIVSFGALYQRVNC